MDDNGVDEQQQAKEEAQDVDSDDDGENDHPQGNENQPPNQILNRNLNVEELEVPAEIDTGMLNYLRNSNDGKAILKQRKECMEKNIPLRKTTRSKLTRLILAREKSRILKDVTENDCLEKFVITKQRFEKLTKEIVFIFKTENGATYFQAFRAVQGKTVLATGKLWNHYNYMKHCLREDKLLRDKEYGQPRRTLNEDELEPDDGNIDWLSSHLEPQDEVRQRWRSSFEHRRLMLGDPELSVHNYMERFPSLQTQLAKDLFAIDFILLYPDKQFVSNEHWVRIREFLIGSINRDAKIKNLEELALKELLNSINLTSDQKDFLVFYLLCHIVKPRRSGKRRRSTEHEAPEKLSIQERRESFILRLEAANEIEAKLADYKQRCLQNHVTFQPLIIATGPPANIRNYYVAVNDNLFSVETVLQAVELSLKVFFSLDCEYPKNTATIWSFLQNILLGIELLTDALTIDTSTLIGHIRNLLSV